MRERLGILLAFVWIAAGAALLISFSINGWSQRPPLWWWILAAAVVGPGFIVLGPGRRARLREARAHATSSLGWWREWPLILWPLGIWATINYIVVFGVVLPVLGVLFLVEGDLAGKLIGVGLLLPSLLEMTRAFRRHRPRTLK